MDYWSVPRLWPGETVAVLGSGPSLKQADVDWLRGRCRVIAVNRSFLLAPWADCLLGADSHEFWAWCGGPDRLYQDEPDALGFAGIKVVLRSGWEDRRTTLPTLAAAGVKVLRHEAAAGLPDDPGVIRGSNGVYHGVVFAAHAGAARVLLLGADMRGLAHFHAPWPKMSAAGEVHLPGFATLVEPLRRRGVEVVNCTPGSALKCWPIVNVREALI